MKFYTYTILGLLLFTPFAYLNAQALCTISIPESFSGDLPNFITEPNTDCNNPFGLTRDLPMPYELKVGEDLYSDHAIVKTEGGLLQLPLDFVGDPEYTFAATYLFRHVETGYEYIHQDLAEMPDPTESEVEMYAETYFNTPTSAQLYAQIYFAADPFAYFQDENGDDILDDETGERVEERFNSFVEYVYEQRVVYPEPINPGVYTLVLDEQMLVVTQRTLKEKIFDAIIPTAHAQYYFPDRRFAITFILEAAPAEAIGASSVLFLPGIQASRLYKEGLFGSTDRVWPPNELLGNDINDLRMTTLGVSEEEIYTSDVIDTTTGVGDVYAGFERFLTDLVQDDVIEDWSPFAYDWRYDVVHIAENGTQYEEGLRSAIDEIEFLANESYSGKVTIVGHSNGGLLAKALLIELENAGKADLVDAVIFLGTPQLGTPKALGTILHGYDQGDDLGGIIMSASGVRKVVNNLPGAYGLLPAENYFEGLTEPIITFNNGESTALYRSVYGSAITNYTDYIEFVRGDDGLDRNVNNSVSIPSQSNVAMLTNALSMHDSLLDTWEAPEGIKIIEIVGTGLPTMKSIEYREIAEDVCFIPGLCEAELKMKPFAQLSHYGDGTVMQLSAEGYKDEKKRYFIDLEKLELSGLDTEYAHHNLTEIRDLQKLIEDLLTGTTTLDSQFISDQHTEFNNVYDIEMIDSPVRMLAMDNAGNQTGVIIVDGVRVIKEEIVGSQYFEFGDTKYLIVPKGTDRIVKLYGEDYGGYSLTTATLNNEDIQVVQTLLQNASTTPDLIAEYSNTNGQYSTVTTDINGDGIIDSETTLEGEVLEEEAVVTYSLLITTIESLSLSKVHKKALLVLVQTAEHYANKTPTNRLYKALEKGVLKAAQELLKVYKKKRFIQTADAVTLQEMIKELKTNN